jgi:phasin family protein
MPINHRYTHAPKTTVGQGQAAAALKETTQVGQRAAGAMNGNVQGVTEAGGILAQGMQKISSEWLNLAQHRLKMNLDGLGKLWACKTPQDLIATQSGLVRENIEKALENSRRIAELSIEVANEAADKINSTARESADHMRRAA